jgi:ribosome-binding factor A
MSAHRSERVGDLIRQLLARLIREELRDPRIGFLTLTDVKLTRDLRFARVYVTVLGQQDSRGTLEALNHATPFLRRALARQAGLRFTPELRFYLDEVAESGQRVDSLLRELRDGEDHER